MSELAARARLYQVTVRPDGDGGYLGKVPAFPGVIAGGDTPEEALMCAYDGIAAMLEVMLRYGDPVPEPEVAAAVR
ncbi:MAG: type II toxin-antitoxin system HicB family antitoxin [Armatimonadetes bacterium]|nr:type II toxin-antitoxin system HicB family antitoxin [Armatimonadota bacterium]